MARVADHMVLNIRTVGTHVAPYPTAETMKHADELYNVPQFGTGGASADKAIVMAVLGC